MELVTSRTVVYVSRSHLAQLPVQTKAFGSQKSIWGVWTRLNLYYKEP